MRCAPGDVMMNITICDIVNLKKSQFVIFVDDRRGKWLVRRRMGANNRAAASGDMSMSRPVLIASAMVVASLRVATAQELPPPEVEARDLTAGGKLIACSLEFSMAFRDNVYRQGKVSAVTGSINLWKRDNGLFSSYKLVGADIDTGKAMVFQVATAQLYSAPTALAEVATKVPCEDDRHYCAGARAEAFLEVLMSALNTGFIRLSFNRKPDGMDVPLQMGVTPAVISNALECSDRLVR